jgi:hypothetical protein
MAKAKAAWGIEVGSAAIKAVRLEPAPKGTHHARSEH